MATVHDLRFERLARSALPCPLPLSEGDFVYVQQNLTAIGESFGLSALPGRPLPRLHGQALARHLADLRSRLHPDTLEQECALGRLESIFRLVASAVQVSRHTQIPTR